MLARTKIRISGTIPPAMIMGTAQLALVIMIFLYQFNIPNTSFLQGLLCGYSIVGNLYTLIHFARTRKEDL